MKTGFNLLANSTWNAAAFVVGVGLNLLVLPFVLRLLGVAPFGVAGLVMACIAPAMIFSGSLSLMITRELAQRLVPERRGEARDFFATALFVALTGSLAIAAVIVVVGPALARRVFNLSGDLAKDLFPAFAFGALGWVFQCVASIFLNLFTARQDYARLALTTIVSTLVSTGLMLVLIPRSPHASTYIACQMAGFAASLLLSASLAKFLFAEWLALPALHSVPLTQLFRRGKWQAIAQGGGMVSAQTDRYLLGMFLLPLNVGYYVVAQRLEEAIYAGVLKVGEILFPFFSSLQGHDDKVVGDLFFRAAWVLNVLAVSLLGAVIPVAGDVLYLWAGTDVAVEGQHVLAILAFGGILGSGMNVFAFYLLANGHTGTNAVISVVTALVTLAVGAVALPYVGWPAAGWSSCAGGLAQLVLISFLIKRSFHLPDIWQRVWHFILMPIATGVACATLLRLWSGPFHAGKEVLWWKLIAWYGMSAATICICVVALSLMSRYRAIFYGDIYRIAARFLPLKGF